MRPSIMPICLAAIVALPSASSAAGRPNALIAEWQKLNSQCRGGSGDDPKTIQACDRREKLGPRIDEAGWCYGKNGQAGYQYQWHACGPGSNHFSH